MAAAASALRNFAPKFALVLASIVVSLAIIEIGLRVAGFEPRRDAVNVGFDSWAGPDVEMGWVNRAGTWKSAEPGNAPMSFEADGRRSDPAGNKPVSLPRVLVVGCSFTQGYGVADDQTFSHFVNQSLPSAELLNFGTGAYGSYQSRLRVNHYFKAAHPKTPLGDLWAVLQPSPARSRADAMDPQPDDEGRQLHGAAEHPHAVRRNH